MDSLLARTLSDTVIAVPPLAMSGPSALNPLENARLLMHLMHLYDGGVRAAIYGGNANLYNMPLGVFEEMLSMLRTITPEGLSIIPSVGPDYGRLVAGSNDLRRPLYARDVAAGHNREHERGSRSGPRGFRTADGLPDLLYLKSELFIDLSTIARLWKSGTVVAVKYAVEREDVAHDPFLEQLLEVVDPRFVVSGFASRLA